MEHASTLKLRPSLIPFMLRLLRKNMGGLTILVLLSFPALAAADLDVPILWVALIYFGLLVMSVVDAVIRSRRAWWEIRPDGVAGGGGGAFSRHQTELELGRITQITLTRPFIQHRLFGTGSVTVKAAGSGAKHLVMRCIPGPEETFHRLQEVMAHSGFSLGRGRKVMDEQPALSECVWFVGKLFLARALLVAVVLGGTVLGLTLLLGLGFALESGGELLAVLQGQAALPDGAPDWVTPALLGWTLLLLIGFAVVGLAWAAGLPALRFAQLRSRHYRLFDDVVEREEGILSRSWQVIPMENLSDVAVAQRPRQRLLGTANVTLSCQGRGPTIQFPWMARAEEFSQQLREILRAGEPGAAAEVGQVASGLDGHDVRDGVGDGGSDATPRATEAPREAAPSLSREPEVALGISLPRALAGYLTQALVGTLSTLLILGLPIWAALTFIPDLAQQMEGHEAWIYGVVLVLALLPLLGFVFRLPVRVIRMRAVRYRIDDREVEGTFALLSRETRRFALHRVTAITSTSGILDRLFGTMSLSFHALGSEQAIRFRHVPAGAVEVESLVRRLGLGGRTRQEGSQTIRANVTPPLWVKAHLPSVLWAVVWIGITTPFALLHPLVLILPVLAILGLVQRFVMEVWDAGSGQLELGSDYLIVRRGRLRRQSFLTGYQHVREVRSRRYPFSDAGSLEVISAGGRRGGLGYLQAPEALHLELDGILLRHPPEQAPRELALDPGQRIRTRPRARNAIIPLTAISVIVVPLLLLYPLLFIATLIQQRRIGYTLEEHRVVETGGLLVRYARSILYDRIDSVSTSRGFLNGLLGNGVVSVSTASGAGAQMRLQNVTEDEGIAQALREGAAAF